VYDASGGFAAVRDSLAEDTALGRRLVRLGYRVALVDGAGVLHSEPYTSLGGLWSANVRNLVSVLFGVGPALALAALLAAVTLGPIALLFATATRSEAPALLGVWLPLGELLLMVLSRGVTDGRTRAPAWLALLQPVALTALAVMLIDAAFRTAWRRDIEWRGRRYGLGDRAA
jgi:hypothetical protein